MLYYAILCYTMLYYTSFDSVSFLISRGGIPRSTGDSPGNADSEILGLWILSMWTGCNFKG